MIIDAHCHAGKGDGLTGPWDTDAPLERYLRRATQAGIGRTVLFAAFHSDYAVANREVARIVHSHPDRFLGFAFVNAAFMGAGAKVWHPWALGAGALAAALIVPVFCYRHYVQDKGRFPDKMLEDLQVGGRPITETKAGILPYVIRKTRTG